MAESAVGTDTPDKSAERSGTAAIAQLAIAATLGLVALPSVLGGVVASAAPSGVSRPEPSIWLGLSVVLVIWLVTIASSLTRFLVGLLASVPWSARLDDDRTTPRVETGLLAALLVAGVYVGLIEAIVRRPLIAAVGAITSPSDVDAIVAAFAVSVLFVVLLRLYRVARPFIESGTWYALASVSTTSSSETTSRFNAPDTASAATVVARPITPVAPVGGNEQTVAATVPASTDATVIAAHTLAIPREDSTVVAPSLDADATRLAPEQSTLPPTA